MFVIMRMSTSKKNEGEFLAIEHTRELAELLASQLDGNYWASDDPGVTVVYEMVEVSRLS